MEILKGAAVLRIVAVAGLKALVALRATVKVNIFAVDCLSLVEQCQWKDPSELSTSWRRVRDGEANKGTRRRGGK